MISCTREHEGKRLGRSKALLPFFDGAWHELGFDAFCKGCGFTAKIIVGMNADRKTRGKHGLATQTVVLPSPRTCQKVCSLARIVS